MTVAREATRPTSAGEPVDVLLVCSAGGHVLQLHLVAAAWQGLTHAWVTLSQEDARSLLAGERVFYANGPTNRSMRNLVKNIPLAWHLVRMLRPKVVVTTGAGVAVPFVWIGRLFGAKIVYIESLTRIRKPSLSYRLSRLAVDVSYAQWPDLTGSLRRPRYVGNVLGGR